MITFKKHRKANADDLIDEVGFRSLFDQYWKPLVAFCQHHIRDDEAAMDLVQDVFCSIWKRRKHLQVNNSMEHYLFRAVRIRISDYYREKFKRENQRHLLSNDFQESINNTEEAVFYKDLNHFLEEQVGRLPYKCQQVYTLSRNKGLTIPEIAQQFSLSEKTVEAHLTKALRFLKTKLTNQLTEK
ncbi:RNA polymerase sigma-70 factor [Olivibacter sp. XZL3]|uniref:RNA polymerase sigma-70 factor n=1 Tax=Olivibacter sp. XZL3 TaxID=1735116 RepID=UPI0014170B4F|nr:RNA polymerase sigma-70 factor [Olivibacter sp. XZL3]